MNKLGADGDKSGNLTGDFQEVKAGRRVVLEFPVCSSIPRCKTITAVVLDSVIVAAGTPIDCAALLVPPQKAEEWIYSSEGGQWQLLASAGVSRLIVLLPNILPTQQVESENELDQLVAVRSTEDDELKKVLRPLVLALAPKALFKLGIPDIPFLAYSDNVVQRVEIDVAYSSITGLMMVEDVEVEESSLLSKSDSKEHGSSQLDSMCTNPTRTWRRRLIFQRMPNLIQTEVSLITYPCRGRPLKGRKRYNGSRSRKTKSSKEAETGEKRVVDHSRLVHQYLPPIVAGFVLISPFLDRYVRSHVRAKVLCVGVGGGALPTFLHNQFGFHIQVHQ